MTLGEPLMKIVERVIGTVAIAIAATIAVPAQAYEESSVVDGGTIEGKVLFRGPVPTRKIIPNKDVDVCGGVREEGAVVYLVEVARGKAWQGASKPPDINNEKCRFVPEVQVIRSGRLDVVNSDPVLHNTHGYYGKRTAFNLALPNQGQRISVELPRPGTVRVDCDAHGWMEAWIYVADNPYYALTGPDGSFTITDVPPGNYTLVAFQPFTGPLQQPVTVAARKPTSLLIELKKS
jgi:plastocyanin